MRAMIVGLLVCLVSTSAAGADYQRRPLEFHHESYGVRELAELRATYDFGEYVAAGKTELERMFLLQDWVYRRVAYGGARKYVDLRNSLTILEKAGEGEVFWCNNIAAVFMQCAVSLGWTARYAFLRSPEGDAHVTNDIWSNELKKWIMVDATWNLHLERNGEVLSIPEVRDVWHRRGMADLVYIFGAGVDEKRYTVADMPIERTDSKLWHWWPVDEKWISFTHAVAYVMRNDFFSIEGGNGGSIWSDIVTIRDGYDEDDPYWEFAGRPGASNLRELFHDVNRVDVRLVPSYETSAARRKGRAPPEEMRVWFDAFGRNNFTPNLDHFLVQVNGGAWNVSSGDLAFQPRRGVNRILVRAVNKFGVQGPVSSCDIAWMPGATPLPQLPLEAWESEGEAPT
jgi:hypothetical protein